MFLVRNLQKIPNIKSSNKAKMATTKLPPNINELLIVENPLYIIDPNPPAPIKALRAHRDTVITKDVLIPPNINFDPKGILILTKIVLSFAPSPSAISVYSLGTEDTPTYVFLTTGKIPYNTKAKIALKFPSPT